MAMPFSYFLSSFLLTCQGERHIQRQLWTRPWVLLSYLKNSTMPSIAFIIQHPSIKHPACFLFSLFFFLSTHETAQYIRQQTHDDHFAEWSSISSLFWYYRFDDGPILFSLLKVGRTGQGHVMDGCDGKQAPPPILVRQVHPSSVLRQYQAHNNSVAFGKSSASYFSPSTIK